MQNDRFYFKNPYQTVRYQQQCFISPILSSVVTGTIFAGLDVAQGARFTPRSVAMYAGGLYTYNVLQCPMEAIHGRRSLLHNFLAGGTLGYIGVSRGIVGIPFINPYTLYAYPSMSPAMVGAAIYGAMGTAFGALGGKWF